MFPGRTTDTKNALRTFLTSSSDFSSDSASRQREGLAPVVLSNLSRLPVVSVTSSVSKRPVVYLNLQLQSQLSLHHRDQLVILLNCRQHPIPMSLLADFFQQRMWRLPTLFRNLPDSRQHVFPLLLYFLPLPILPDSALLQRGILH